jgi:hypothetical protein
VRLHARYQQAVNHLTNGQGPWESAVLRGRYMPTHCAINIVDAGDSTSVGLVYRTLQATELDIADLGGSARGLELPLPFVYQQQTGDGTA